MADNVTLLMLCLRLANIIVSAYLFKVLFSIVFFGQHGTFLRTMKVMLAAVLVYFMVELVQLFRVFSGPEFELIQSAFAFSFLLLLLWAVLEIHRSMKAHEHLVRHRHRQRLSDVD